MEITKALEAINKAEEELKKTTQFMENYKNISKLFKHKCFITPDEDVSKKRSFKSLAKEYAQYYAQYRTRLVIAERKLRVAKLRLKKYLEEV